MTNSSKGSDRTELFVTRNMIGAADQLITNDVTAPETGIFLTAISFYPNANDKQVT